MRLPITALRGDAAPQWSRGPTARVALTVLLCAALLLGGCRALRHKDEPAGSAESMYRRATKLMHDGSYDAAIKALEALTARYPFSDPARQSRLDLIYAYYKQREKDAAIDAADTFIRENPTHPRIDYAYYMKGLVYFERAPNFLERRFDVDVATRPPQDVRKSFDAFLRVVTQYPASEYAADARQRMIYLRNRLAEYEMHVARYYVRRGAFVAALDRARTVIETYDGAPSTPAALALTVQCYRELGLTDLADDAAKVLAANFPNAPPVPRQRHWWQRAVK